MRRKNLNLRFLVTLIAFMAMVVPTAMLKAQSSGPLCFTARGGSVNVTFTLKSGFTPVIQYSTDGTNWTNCTQPTTSASAATTIPLNQNESVYFQAASDHTTAFGELDSSGKPCSSFSFSGSGTVEASGNIMSLFGPNYSNNLTVPSAANCAFKKLFSNCTKLTKAPELPATTLTTNCYNQMFRGCTALTTAPILPATTLAKHCYHNMFNGCTGLTAAPALPATTLVSNCYYQMFYGCTGLTAAPALPATTLLSYCYYEMFRGCTGLTAAPALPATTLASYCYHRMFYGCTGLTAAPALPATTLPIYCYYEMFCGCTSLNDIPILNAQTLDFCCCCGMFLKCTSLKVNTSGPGKEWIITAATTASSALSNMFTNTGGTMNGTPTVNTTYYINNPLKFTARGGSVNVTFTLRSGFTETIEYSTDGTNWIDYTSGSQISLNQDESVYFRAENEQTTATAFGNSNDNNNSKFTFSRNGNSTAKVEASGNIMSLFGPSCPALTLPQYAFHHLFDGCNLLQTAPNLPATNLAQGCYRCMFEGCTALTTAPTLPTTSLAVCCYEYMFKGCTALTTAPALNATTLTQYCYANMFNGCTALTTPPTMQATTLGGAAYCCLNMFEGCTALVNAPTLSSQNAENNCYQKMFKGCTSLVTAPALPATTVNNSCYASMFEGCTSLTNAPTLPATTATTECYASMFEGCTSLTNAPALDATTVDNSCYASMFEGCTSLTNAPALPATTATTDCYVNMFKGCTSLVNAPDLPATTVNNSCYAGMFEGCTSLINAPALNATSLSWDCYNSMFKGCTSLVTAPALPATTLSGYCYASMFENCTALTAAPTLDATQLSQYCYATMFKGCTSLASAPSLPATTLYEGCYRYMFSGCTLLTAAPNLSAETLAVCCYEYMFDGCTSLTSAPALPATTLANWCYARMFQGCTSLTTAPELFATKMASYCYKEMFSGCTAMKTAPELPATTLAECCYQSMFNNCTALVAAPELPAETLSNYCYNQMFQNCSTLTALPELPATTLTTECYKEMFKNCSTLVVNTTGTAKEWKIIATNLSGALDDMFSGTNGDMNGTPAVNTPYYITGATKHTVADGNWDNTAIWSDGKIPGDFDDVTIQNKVTIPNGVNAHCDNLTLNISNTTDTLIVEPLASLHTKTLTNSNAAHLLIESDANGTGTVRFETGSPKATVQMYLKGTTAFDAEDNPTPEWQYRGFIGTPDAGQKLSDVVIYVWDEETNKTTCWSQYYDGYANKNKTANFVPWIGLAVANFKGSAVTPTYTTTLEATNVGHTYNALTRTGTNTGSTTAPNYGVNLVTNSYSTPINLDAIASSDMVNLEQTFYFFNTCTKAESKDTASAVTTYPKLTGNYIHTTNPYIPAGQSFAVRATAASPSLTIPALAVTTVRSKAMYAPKKDSDPMIVKITVDGDEAMDELFLLQMEECTSGFDNGYDGTKLLSTKSNQIYATNEYGTTAVNADMTLLGQYIGFKPLSKGRTDVTMRISARNYEGYDELYLYDHQTGEYVEISEDEVTYTFSSTGEESQRRFQIVGKADDGTIYEPAGEERIEVAGGEIYLMNFDRTDAQIIMADASGRIVWSANTNMGKRFTLPELPRGVYFIRCGNATAKHIAK